MVESRVLHVDDELLAVDKPPGIAVIPEGYRREAPCLVRLLEERWGRLWVVHRLDRDTSGVVLFGRSERAHRGMNDQFAAHRVRKVYHFIARGEPVWSQLVVDTPLRADGDGEHRTVADRAGGKPSLTRLRVLERFRGACLVEALPESGRTHQIRVHAALAGHPAVADPLYGDGEPLMLSAIKRGYKGDRAAERPLIDRVALHAMSVAFEHPVTASPLEVTCPYHRDMAAALRQLARQAGGKSPG